MDIEERKAPFSAVAERYDAEFSQHPLGVAKRDLVHSILKPLLTPRTHILELNGGTGEDALRLAPQVASIITTDASAGMLEVARRKLTARLPSGVAVPTLGVLRIEELWGVDHDVDPDPGSDSDDTLTLVKTKAPYDLILSNFDGLNCVQDHQSMARALHGLVRPGGEVVLVFMTRHPLIEKIRDLLRGRFGRIIGGRGVIDGTEVAIGDGHTIRTWFPPVGDVIEALSDAGFIQVETRAIGLFIPPTTMKDFYLRHQNTFKATAPVDRLLSGLPVLNRMGDHVLVRVRRGEMCELG